MKRAGCLLTAATGAGPLPNPYGVLRAGCDAGGELVMNAGGELVMNAGGDLLTEAEDDCALAGASGAALGGKKTGLSSIKRCWTICAL